MLPSRTAEEATVDSSAIHDQPPSASELKYQSGGVAAEPLSRLLLINVRSFHLCVNSADASLSDLSCRVFKGAFHGGAAE